MRRLAGRGASVARPRPRARRRPRATTLLAVLVLLLVALAAVVPLPYVVMSPGPATNTLGTSAEGKPLISVPPAKDHPASGVLAFTTVSVLGGPGRRVTAYDLLWARLAGHREIVPEEEIYPKGKTGQQVKEENAADMTHSQEDAVVVAERAAGLTVPEKVTVGQVLPGSPAAGRLREGDRVVEVAGRPVSSSAALRKQVQTYAEGQAVPLVVVRAGARRAVQVPVMVRDGRRLMGVGLEVDYSLPVPVRIDAGDVGGPSAGLMFSLGVYERLTPGELTGGRRIAGTGTISTDGEVGPIGGVQQKVVGARAAGAQWFLTPAGNCAELRGAVPDGIRAVKVSSFEQALADVRAIAAGRTGGLPTCG